MESFLGSLAVGFRCALEPLSHSFHSTEELKRLFQRFGWDVTPSLTQLGAMRTAFSSIETLFHDVQGLANSIEDGTAGNELEVAIHAIDTLKDITSALVSLSTAAPAGLPFPLDQSALWDQVRTELPDFLLLRFLEGSQPGVFAALVMIGIAEIEPATPTGANRIPYERYRIDWSRLPRSVTAPEEILRDIYHWDDTTPFDHERLLSNLERSFRALKLPARRVTPRPALATRYYDPANPALASVRELDVSFFQRATPDKMDTIELGVTLLPIPPAGQNNAAPQGFVLTPLAKGTIGAGIETGSPILVEIRGGFDASDSILMEMRPSGVTMTTAGAPAIDAMLSISGMAPPSAPWIVLGGAGSHRIEAGGFFAGIGMKGRPADPEWIIEIATGRGANPPKLAIVIQMSEGDGFLKSIFGTEPQRIEFGGKLRWSSKSGLSFSGSAGVQLVFPVNLTLGPVSIDSITAGLLASEDGLAVNLGVTGSVDIGPVAASVQNIGVSLKLIPVAAGTGAVNNLDVAFGFKPPDGIGLVVNAGPVTGGGFLFIDTAQGRYAGILQLDVFSISIKAIALIDTRLPDGPGFSFLIIITATFPPMQLGYGFTLNGVGGLAGIHRTLMTEPLRSGIRNHSVDHILFPEDPIRDATRIISDLSLIFPPMRDHYVFGPMAVIGWGPASIIEAELGVIIQLPDPIRIVLLGQVNAYFPVRDAAVVELHLDILGILDFGAKLFSLDGTLHDSRIAVFSLSGDFALRVSWGEQPNFAFSLGGLHPQFQPPPNFPALRRLTLSLGTGDNPRLSLQCYLALTSNSVQFGARLELYAEAGGFNLYGWLGFDVLVIFSPLSLRADLSAGIALRRGTSVIAGIGLEATLTGPGPWHAWGEACLSLWLFDICVPFDATFGENQNRQVPGLDPWIKLDAAIRDARNWSAALPPASARTVSLITPETTTTPTIFVDPLGSISFHEKVVPLNRVITRFEEADPAVHDHFNLESVTVAGATVSSWTAVRDFFARGQFAKLTDDEKLAPPAFDKMDSGVTLASAAVTSGPAVGTDLTYETIIIDSPWDSRPAPLYMVALRVQASLLQISAAAIAGMRANGFEKYGPVDPRDTKLAFDDEELTIATKAELAHRADIEHDGTHTSAHLALAAYLVAHPEERGTLQIVPRYEVAA